MIGISLIAIMFVLAIFFLFNSEKKPEDLPISPKLSEQLDKLWGIAQDAMKQQKIQRAEKALLTILRFDEKNATAYNRLGILYARMRQFKEAIECFEIAQSLDNNASSLHNVGLIYLETGNFEKAALAFEQAIEIEDDLPNRYVAYAKAEEKLGNYKKALDALENAFLLEKSSQTLRKIAEIYALMEDEEGVAETKKRMEKLIESRRKIKRIQAPKKRKVIM